MTDHQANLIFLGVVWFAWALSCRWLGFFGLFIALVLAVVTAGIVGVK